MTKVMIVEDDIVLSESLKQKLTTKGYEVLVAANGIEALNELKYNRVDVILLDLIMPQIDGITFIYEARQQHSSLPPIIVLTNLEQTALPEGISAFLIKAQTSLEKIVVEIEKHVQHKT